MAKKIIRGILAIVLMALPIDWTLRTLQRITAVIARLVFFRDWKLRAYGLPQFFKHQINLNLWIQEPSRWSFTARGVYARENMFKGCTVLDLCCGDGSYSYLFFSDIAKSIDAVDNDAHALAYAKRYFAAATIKYHRINIVEQRLPVDRNFYDVVVWNAAICYFSESEIKIIIEKIIAAGKNGMVLCGMLPAASGYADHKFEFQSCDSIKSFFHDYFNTVTIKEVAEMSAGGERQKLSYYFCASNPLQIKQEGSHA